MVSEQKNPVNELKISSVEFVKSSVSVETCPTQNFPEYAFIGRSNVGKSSLINLICGRKMVARVSSSPGKTQTINHYLINKEWFLTDLPGYGFAKSSKSNREEWSVMIRNYILKRTNLVNVFLLIDSRIKPQKPDLEFMEWLATQGIPFIILYTKIDKLSRNELQKNMDMYQQELLESWEELPMMMQTSAEKKIGRPLVLSFIQEQNNAFKNF